MLESKMMSERLTGEASPHQELEVLSVSKRLVRSVSQKLKRKNHGNVVENDDDDMRGVSFRCLTLYPRAGGCKVGDEFGDLSCQKRSSTLPVRGYGVERFWKRSSRKILEVKESSVHVFLPDDIIEMCLMRLPLASLMNTRLVCKKWRTLTTTPRFMQMRREGLYPSPWLFLFGAVKDGYCSREIHALDVSLNKWHRVESEILKGRFLFSVAGIQNDIYVVGGCSSLTSFGEMDKSLFKTHKGVLVFSSLTKSWNKVASMKHARSKPILGVYEVNSDCLIIKSQHNRQDRRLDRTRIGVSNVYDNPCSSSVRRRLRHSFDETEVSSVSFTKPYKFARQKTEHSTTKDRKRVLLMAIGGRGLWDEPLDSGEIYDSLSNKWTEIQRLPVGFGVVCSAIVCSEMFYVYSETDNLAAYDIGKGFWVGIETTFPPRVHEYHPKLVSCDDGRLFMVSVSWCEGDGEIGRRNKAVRKLWELDLVGGVTWTEVSTHPDAPMDWDARFVGDKNMIFGVEMFKIFGQVLEFLTMFDVSDTRKKWIHVSGNKVARELDVCSCLTKSMAVLHL